MVRQLKEADSIGRLPGKMRLYQRPDVLVVDLCRARDYAERGAGVTGRNHGEGCSFRHSRGWTSSAGAALHLTYSCHDSAAKGPCRVGVLLTCAQTAEGSRSSAGDIRRSVRSLARRRPRSSTWSELASHPVTWAKPWLPGVCWRIPRDGVHLSCARVVVNRPAAHQSQVSGETSWRPPSMPCLRSPRANSSASSGAWTAEFSIIQP